MSRRAHKHSASKRAAKRRARVAREKKRQAAVSRSKQARRLLLADLIDQIPTEERLAGLAPDLAGKQRRLFEEIARSAGVPRQRRRRLTRDVDAVLRIKRAQEYRPGGEAA